MTEARMEEATPMPAPPAPPAAPRTEAWRHTLAPLVLLLAAIGLAFFDSFRAMEAIWSRSDTFAHAYVVRGAGPLVVGVLGGYVWVIWQAAWSFDDVLEGLLAVAAVGVLGLAAAALHESRPDQERWTSFAAVWREAGAIALLGVLFTAALPFVESDGMGWPAVLVVLLAVAVVAAAAAVVLGLRPGAAPWAWAEPVGGVAVTLLSLLLVAWEAGSDSSSVGAEDWAHAVLSVALYLAVATGVAVVGILRDSGRLTFIALAALAVACVVLALSVHAPVAMGVAVGLLGVGAFATVAPLQLRVLQEARGGQNLASSLNIAAFNLGNAFGAWLGGVVVASGAGLPATPWVAAGVTLSGLAVAAWSVRLAQRDRTAVACARAG